MIYRTAEEWEVRIFYETSWRDSGPVLTLTNKRLICGKTTIELVDIESVDIKTRTSGPPQVMVTHKDGAAIIDIRRRGKGQLFKVIVSAEPSNSDIVAYVGYLAALITMVAFHFGSPKPFLS